MAKIKKREYSRKEAIGKLWELGDLSYKLKGIQKDMRSAVYTKNRKKTVFLVSRRTGKTFVMMCLAVEQCIKKSNSIVKVLFPKKKDAKEVSRFQMKTILEDCPEHLRPEWKEADKLYIFPNGSEIQMAGTDSGNAESVRGSACDLAILDEAGFHDYNDFTYIVNSIIMPTLLTTKGKIILASTPSREPDHSFMTDYVLKAEKDGELIKYDIYDNPMITEQDIQDEAENFPGGMEDPDFKREYLLITDVVSSDFIIPEYTADLENDIVKEVPKKPSYYDYYVSGDPAATDLTVILFAYYDYLKNQLVVCDELVMGGENDVITTQDIADGIRRKEKLNFTHELTGELNEPYLRVMDNNNLILINDLSSEHGLFFIPTAKDNKEAQVNKLRMYIKGGKIIKNPKCKVLRYQLIVVHWDKNKIKFLTLKGDKNKGMKPHHCDAVDALIYLVRNVDFNKNPYPDGHFELSGEGVFHPMGKDYHKNKELSDLATSMMNMKKPKINN